VLDANPRVERGDRVLGLPRCCVTVTATAETFFGHEMTGACMSTSAQCVFFGRQDELQQWRDVLASPKGQAVLVTGPWGMGKSALLRQMAQVAESYPDLHCGSVLYEPVPTDAVEATMELMLGDAYDAANLIAGSFAPTEERRRQWAALFKAVLPQGNEIVELVQALNYAPTRLIRKQLAERLRHISNAMDENGRAVFFIDPDNYLPDNSADAWRQLINKLPDRFKIVFAQRSDGVLVHNDNFQRLATQGSLVRIPEGELAYLDEDSVRQWAETRAADLNRSSEQLHDAVAKYHGYPFSIDAAFRLIGQGYEPADLPDDPEALAAELWKEVLGRCRESGRDDAAHLLCAHAILEVPVPDELAQTVAGLDEIGHSALLDDPLVGGLLPETGRGRAIYHYVFRRYITNCLSEPDALAYHQCAIRAYRDMLAAEGPPDERAVTRLPEHVRTVEGDAAWVRCFVEECVGPMLTLGLYASAVETSHRALDSDAVTSVSKEEAVLCGNLGLIYRKRGELEEAERMHRRALEIDEQLGRRKGIASAYGNLGLLYWTRGDLDEAERMCCRALDIEEQLGRREGMANAYGNLGLIYQMRSDLDEAEKMYHQALDIDEQLDRSEGVANAYGNLGLIYWTRGDLDEAERMHRRALEINEQLGWLEGMANAYGNLGLVYQMRSDLDEAERMYCRALDIEEQLSRREGMASVYGNLGLIYQARGDLEEAEKMHRWALEINEQIGRRRGIASQYGNLGEIHKVRGDDAKARRLWLKARDLYEQIGMPPMVEKIDGWLTELPEDDHDG